MEAAMAWLYGYLVTHIIFAVLAFALANYNFQFSYRDKVDIALCLFLSLLGGPLTFATWSFHNKILDNSKFGLKFKIER